MDLIEYLLTETPLTTGILVEIEIASGPVKSIFLYLSYSTVASQSKSPWIWLPTLGDTLILNLHVASFSFLSPLIKTKISKILILSLTPALYALVTSHAKKN